jgi:hypothetical protein
VIRCCIDVLLGDNMRRFILYVVLCLGCAFAPCLNVASAASSRKWRRKTIFLPVIKAEIKFICSGDMFARKRSDEFDRECTSWSKLRTISACVSLATQILRIYAVSGDMVIRRRLGRSLTAPAPSGRWRIRSVSASTGTTARAGSPTALRRAAPWRRRRAPPARRHRPWRCACAPP